MKKVKFYKCDKCERIKCVINDKEDDLECCGNKMIELEPNTVDAATEKHIPVYEVNGTTVNVKVGEELHPMTKEHYIKWIAYVGKDNVNFERLDPSDKPTVSFNIDGEFEIYSYCNLHGLWSSK
ncbi:MAG: desulfoferrodoxin [Clostridia bacterium]|nr:desulfoferrodoxin [Clostridia bacterium]